ncbi:MAG TPA: 2OG-Fe(II) oxygenase [Burkholderiaceae bacterium]|nr:2OG-Fe(II) oxygenase [Burkholderiaceae bacterium]
MAARPESVDWAWALEELDREGVVCLPGLLSGTTCKALIDGPVARPRPDFPMPSPAAEALAEAPLPEPLPDPLHRLRALLYRRVLPLARRWAGWLQQPADPPAPAEDIVFADTHEEHLAACRRDGRSRPLCRLLRMGAGARLPLRRQPDDEPAFPLIATVLLSEPGREFTGGELVLTEQRPRMQSRPFVVTMQAGSVALLAGGHHPQRGARGLYRVTTRHAVSRVHDGERCAVDLRFDLGRGR